LGHRGFTHSIFFALCCGAMAAMRHRWFGVRAMNIFLFLSMAMISHGVLDALTYGGLGVEIAWPFSFDRFFFPWRPLPVSPIGPKYFFNHWGMLIFKAEMFRVWLPMVVFMVCAIVARRLWALK
jgi:inner membrane protein